MADRPDPAAALPATSLIICSRNRPEMLADTVKSILEGRDRPSEIVVVDQSDLPHPSLGGMASTDSTQIRYLWTKTPGLSRANNLGVAAAKHDVLIFTHDDVLLDRAWFGTLVRALLAAGPGAAVTGMVEPGEERPGGFQLAVKTDPRPAVYTGRLIGQDVLFPMTMAFYRSAFNRAGGFDERLGPGTRFPAAEDNDLGFRLLEKGYRIVYVPGAVLYHRAWRPARDFLPLRWSYGVGQGAFYAKHISLRDRYMIGRMARDVTSRLALSLTLFSRDRRRAAGYAVHAAGIMYGAGAWVLTGTAVSQRFGPILSGNRPPRCSKGDA